MKRVKVILSAAVAALAIIVVLQNTRPVETKLLFATVTLPHAVLLLVTLLAGVVVGLVGATALMKRNSTGKRDGPSRARPGSSTR